MSASPAALADNIYDALGVLVAIGVERAGRRQTVDQRLVS